MGSFRKFSKIAAIIAVGGAVSRWHGGGISKLPNFSKSVKNCIWAVPFATTVYFSVVDWRLALICFVLCLAGKATGHGGGMDLGTNPKEPFNGRRVEKLEYLILWLYPHAKAYGLVYYYDALLLSLTGLAATSGAVAVFSYIGNASAVVALTLAGLLKGPCYMLGRKISVKYATELGEFFTGLAAFAGIAYVLALYNLI